MSQERGSKSKTPTATIKIAGTNGSGRSPTADVGPGDPAAAPSEAPELVEVPAAPTPSELVVKSVSTGPATTSPSRSNVGTQTGASVSGGSEKAPHFSNKLPDIGAEAQASGAPTEGGSANVAGISQYAGNSQLGGPASKSSSRHSGTGNMSNKLNSGSGSKMAASPSAFVATKSTKSHTGTVTSPGAISPSPSEQEGESPRASSASSTGSHAKSPRGSAKTSPAGKGSHDKKVTKFRYHRRVTVHTTGKVSPKGILEKVTPSTLEDMNPEELIKKAGIKPNNDTHWRIRLRQTKRLTKGGKTTTQTRVAYRDSEGNANSKREGPDSSAGGSSSGRCKKCGKKSEDCKCGS